MHIVRRSQFKSSSWKNGGGITHEAMRVPERGDPFLWRVSLAHIDVSGPFSDFAGYVRTMVLLRGAGVDLRLSDGSRRILETVGDVAEFDGALRAECELLNGPCVDLNLMTAKAMGHVRSRVERLQRPLSVAGRADESIVIFPIEAPLEIYAGDGDSARLDPWDLAVLEGTAAGPGHIASRDNALGAVFLAILNGAARSGPPR